MSSAVSTLVCAEGLRHWLDPSHCLTLTAFPMAICHGADLLMEIQAAGCIHFSGLPDRSIQMRAL